MKKLSVTLELTLSELCAGEPITLSVLRPALRRLVDAQGCSVVPIIVCETDFERKGVMFLPGAVQVEKYGSNVPKYNREIGACEQFRFISADKRSGKDRREENL